MKGQFEYLNRIYRYIRYLEGHTGGGDGDADDLEDEEARRRREDEGFSEKVCEAFRKAGLYELFDAAYVSHTLHYSHVLIFTNPCTLA